MKKRNRDDDGFLVFQQLGESTKELLRHDGLLAPAPRAKAEDLRSDDQRQLAQLRWEKRNPKADTHSKNWAQRKKAALRWFKQELKFRLKMMVRDAERKQAAKRKKKTQKKFGSFTGGLRRNMKGKAPISRQGIRVLS